LRFIRLLLVMLGFAILLPACTSTETLTAEPTQTLIPATDTAVPSPIPPTATSAGLPRPGDLVTPEINTPELVPSVSPDAASTLDDPIANDLVGLAQRRVAQDLNLPVRRIQLVEVKAYHWIDSSLGCPLPGQSYTQVLIDGYRIILEAGDKQYIFHTDFDRALPCDPANEKLPPD
jgi:hypothetical protein